MQSPMVLKDAEENMLLGRLRCGLFNPQKTFELLLSCKTIKIQKKNHFYLCQS